MGSLAAAVHPTQAEEEVVEGQPRQGRKTHREKGEMRPAGLWEVERAKSDGRWDAAYKAQNRATVPDDLRRELEMTEVAREVFSNLDRKNRCAILHRVQDTKKPETRARRIEKYVAMLSEEKKIYP
jgi:uncharacterized protein YdeI (YjbR/CyaY-like superfamily)